MSVAREIGLFVFLWGELLSLLEHRLRSQSVSRQNCGVGKGEGVPKECEEEDVHYHLLPLCCLCHCGVQRPGQARQVLSLIVCFPSYHHRI